MSRTRLLSAALFIFALMLLFAVLGAQIVNTFAQEDGGKAIISATISAATVSAEGPALTLALPAPAKVGELITVTLVVDNAANLAGFQTTLTYDAQGLKYATAAPVEAFAGGGREVLPLDPVRKEGAVVLGGATCPVADCDAVLYQQSRNVVTTTGGAIELATFSFLVREPGTHQIHLGETLLVDSAGNPLLATPSFLESTAQNPEPAVVDLDVTGNNIVNDSDAWALISSWYDLQKEDQCVSNAFARYDVDANGCIDVADVQKVLSAWGESPDPELVARLKDSATEATITLTVDSSGDQGDAHKGDGVCRTSSNTCTLRAALEEANVHPGPEVIQFDIRNTNGSCPNLVVIAPDRPLEVDAADNQPVTIDGHSQCDASPNTQAVNGNASVKIEIQGTDTRLEFGLIIRSSNNVVKGLAIYEWHRQIYIIGAHYNRIEGNFLGTDSTQTKRSAVSAAEVEGIHIRSAYNTVGGVTPAARNIVAGNNQDGVNIEGSGADYNLVIGNYIGLTQDGRTAQKNNADGVDIAAGAGYNQIGGLNPGERNVISGNGRDGVEISHDITTQYNLVVGNFIGLNAAGTDATMNGQKGVTFEDEVNLNKVYRNIIVGSGHNGVRFYTVYDNEVFNNFIGLYPPGIRPADIIPRPSDVNLDSLIPLPNGQNVGSDADNGGNAVFITAGSHNNALRDNIIAHHPGHGIYLNSSPGYLGFDWTCDTYFNTFSRNSIYDNEKEGIRLNGGDCNGERVDPNHGLPEPVINSATTAIVSGTACNNCIVEVFVADKTAVNAPDGDNHGEGKIYVGSATAGDSGSFAVSVSGITQDQLVTATATSIDGDTSEFARNVLVTTGPPPPGEEEYELFLPFVIRN